MKGRITEYRRAEARGTIAAFNAERYSFGHADWRSSGEPQAGLDVEFLIDGRSAKEIALRAPGTPSPVAVRSSVAVPSSDSAPTPLGDNMSFLDAVNICFEKFATLEGRARRKEFWCFALFAALAQIVVGFVLVIPFGRAALAISTLLSLALTVPWAAALTRRFHDTDRSGYWMVALYLVPTGYFLALRMAPRTITTVVLQLGAVPLILPVLVAMTLAVIAALVLAALHGTSGPNRYGADPLTPEEEYF